MQPCHQLYATYQIETMKSLPYIINIFVHDSSHHFAQLTPIKAFAFIQDPTGQNEWLLSDATTLHSYPNFAHVMFLFA